MLSNPKVSQRFFDKIAVGDDCWEWTASLSSPGRYGLFTSGGRNWYAHRVSYEHFVGPIPDGLQIDHLCRNPRCVRPDHLEPVTCRENVLRGESPSARNAKKTHCPRGHEYTPENTGINGNDGGRYCRTCNREWCRRYQARTRHGQS